MTVLLSDVFVKITRRDSQFFARLRVQFEKCLSNNNSMFKPYLTYFLLALLALQSVVATSDAHQSHQSGAEHLNFDTSHQHADETEHFDHNSESESQHSDWDCHHCCHCHGMTNLYLGDNPDNLIPTTSGKGSSDYHFIYHSYAGSPDNPPPIG